MKLLFQLSTNHSNWHECSCWCGLCVGGNWV